MYSSKRAVGNIFLSWQFIALQLLAIALFVISMEPKTGGMAGRIAFEDPGFHLYSYGLKNRKVSAVAIGPRGDKSDERGVWVNQDGTFRIDRLPVGEYQMRIRAPGFSTEYQNDVFVNEGKITNIQHPIQLSLLSPNLNIGCNVRVFTTKEQPSLWVNATATNRVEIDVYKKDFLKLRTALEEKGEIQKMGYNFSGNDFSVYRNTDFVDVYANERSVYHAARKISLAYEDSQRVDFKFEKPLPAGEYVAVSRAFDLKGAQEAGDILLFQVTDLGLIVKKAPDGILARTIDLNTLKPVPGAKIRAYYSNYSTASGKEVISGKDGFVRLDIPKEELNQNQEVIALLGANRAFDNMNYWENNADHYHTYMYTDRPVYRLGQTVYFKGIARQLTAKGMTNPGKELKLEVNVKDPDGNSIKHNWIKPSEHGTFHDVCTVPEDGKTGGYQIEVAYWPADHKESETSESSLDTAYESFEVLQYRKPEYQVDVTPLVPRISAGEPGKMRIHAAYYFGAPVANAKISYSIYSTTNWNVRRSLMPRPDYYGYFDSWESDEGSYDGGGELVLQGNAQTDANGEAIVSFDTQPVTIDHDVPTVSEYFDRSYRLEAEVTDLSRMSVVSSGSLLVTPGDFSLFVSPDSYVSKVGDPFHVTVSAEDYESHAVANAKVHVRVIRYKYDQHKGEYRGFEVAAESDVTTDGEGKAITTVDCKEKWPSDTFYVTAEATDSKKHNIFTTTSIWIANPNSPYVRYGQAAEKEALTVKTDKEIYKPGEVARIMVTAPVTGTEGADAIVAVEGTQIYSYKVVPLTATAQLIEVPIKKEYIPNAYFTVTFVGKKHQFYNNETMIKVSPEQNFLNLAISTDKQRYRPGDTVSYTVKAAHLDGRPAANTELSLGVVDESIYAIRPDTAANIQHFFYSKRNNWVTTSCSFPEEYSGGPDKTEPRIRKDFRDTAAWLPELRTDKDGIARASIKVPDNLTTWRATVRGIDMATNVGAATQKITVTQDLIVRLAMPRFFTQGDKGFITAIVHNYTDKPQAVSVKLSPPPELDIDLSKAPLLETLRIAPDKADRFCWPVTATRAGKASVLIKAIGQTASDAVEQSVPIRPLGIPAFSIKSGLLAGEHDSVQLPAGLSGDAQPGTVKYELDVASSTIGPVIGNFNKLIEYPYGCTEQTMSRLVPSVVAYKLHQELHLPLSKKDELRFQKVYKIAMPKLLEYHHGDGGWGWWKDDQSNSYLTCYVLEGLHLLESLKVFPVDHNLLLDGDKYLTKQMGELQKQLSNKDLVKDRWLEWEYCTDLSRVLYTVSLSTKPSHDQLQWLTARYLTLPPEALAYLTMALHRAGDEQSAKQVYERLISLANVSKESVDWDHTRAMFARLKVMGVEDYSYRFTGAETTALALNAVLDMEPNNTDRVEAIKRWLLLQRDLSGWGNTKTTAQIFLVFLKEELISRKTNPPNFTYTAKLGDKLLQDYSFNPNNAYQGEFVTDVPVPDHPTKLTLTKEGTGRLYYTNSISYFRNMKPGDLVADKGSLSGLKVSRSFFHVVPVTNKSDGSMHFSTVPIKDGKVKAGETILMKVFVESPISVPYTMVEAPLPSGAEVIDNQSRENNLEGETSGHSSYEADWAAPWWTHQDILDDRIVFFCTHLEAGKNEFHTMLRMEMPGSINIDPISMEGMYTKKIRAYSELNAMSISE